MRVPRSLGPRPSRSPRCASRATQAGAFASPGSGTGRAVSRILQLVSGIRYPPPRIPKEVPDGSRSVAAQRRPPVNVQSDPDPEGGRRPLTPGIFSLREQTGGEHGRPTDRNGKGRLPDAQYQKNKTRLRRPLRFPVRTARRGDQGIYEFAAVLPSLKMASRRSPRFATWKEFLNIQRAACEPCGRSKRAATDGNCKKEAPTRFRFSSALAGFDRPLTPPDYTIYLSGRSHSKRDMLGMIVLLEV